MDWIILFSNTNEFSKEISLFKPEIYSGILLIINGEPLILDAITGLKCPKGSYQIKGKAYRSKKSLAPIINELPKEINLEKLAAFIIGDGPFVTGYDIINNFLTKKYCESPGIHTNIHISNPLPIPPLYTSIDYKSEAKLPEVNLLNKYIVAELLLSPRPKIPPNSLSRLRLALFKLPPEILHLYEIDLAFNQIASEIGVPCIAIPPMPNKSDLVKIINNVHPSLCEALEREIIKRK